jgi:tetratricopeptide repeat protein 8
MATKPLDPLFLAYSQYRRRKHADCIASCDALLEKHPTDTQAWFLKIRSLTQAAWIDDADLDDVSVADAMLDSHGTAQTPRPGTSLARVGTSHSNANPSYALLLLLLLLMIRMSIVWSKIVVYSCHMYVGI